MNTNWFSLGLALALSASIACAEERLPREEIPLVIRAGVMIELGKLDQLEKAIQSDSKLLTAEGIHGQLMHGAAYHGRIDAIQLLLKYGGSLEQLNSDYHSPFHVAAFWNHVDVLSLMLENGVDIDSRGTGKPEGVTIKRHSIQHATALNEAASSGAEEAVRFLLSKGAKWDANPPEIRFTALHAAMTGWWVRRESRIKFQREIDPSVGPLPAVGNEVVIDLLVKAGADFRSKSAEGEEPIHIASRGLKLETLRILMAKYRDRIDINAPDRFGRTPLKLAMMPSAASGDERKLRLQAVVELLKDNGASETASK